MTGLLTSLLMSSICLTPSAGHAVEADSLNREALYAQGVSYETFLQDAERRTERWQQNTASAQIGPDLLARAGAAGGKWMLLVVAVDGCSDSVSTIPYIARLVDELDNLDMRIVHPDVGRQVMVDHPTPDGRPATPTAVLLNEDFDEVGCFIERPAPLQDWALEYKEQMSIDDYLEQKFAWYDEDAGRHTVAEIVALLEGAAAGQKGC